VLAGDVFDAWWGWREVVPAAFVPLLAELWEIRRRGVAVTWVPGNHDFAVGEFVERTLEIPVVPVWRTVSNGRRVVVVHGDRADRSFSQRVVTHVLRGFGGRAAMRVLGPDRGLEVARFLSRSSRTHGGSGQDYILDQQRRLADGWLGGEADIVCVGHSHAPGIEERACGRLVNLGDWVQHHTFGLLEAGDVRLLQWKGSLALPVPPGPMRGHI
jgi:UDP-2,3-diacylglucosamine hydrolase